MYKYYLLFLISICFLFVVKFSFAQSGDTNVNATVDNPIGSTPTPTATPTSTATPSPTPTLTPSGSISPTPIGGISPTPSPSPTPSGSPTPTPAPPKTYYLDITGIVSPNASIVLYSNSQFVRSTTADKDGNFFISKILVYENFTDFCLAAVDFKRIGESYTCYKIPPVIADTNKSVFLPPTIGLSARKITRSASVFAFGYTMPSASTKVHVGAGIDLLATADKTGFYKVEVKNLATGKYQLFATANYKTKDSEKPSKTLELESLSTVGAIKEGLKDKLQRLLSWIVSFFLKFGWIAIPVIILIVILLSKKLRDRIRSILKVPASGKSKDEYFGHHYWFVGE